MTETLLGRANPAMSGWERRLDEVSGKTENHMEKMPLDTFCLENIDKYNQLLVIKARRVKDDAFKL